MSMESAVADTLKWLEKQTNLRTLYPQMLCGERQGRMLSSLIRLTGARKALEIGSFTGYSAIWIASALPEGGTLDTYEVNDELEDLITQAFSRSGLSERINLHIADVLDSLEGDGYDFVYIDGNKRDYLRYYNLVMPRLKKGALMVADDTVQASKELSSFLEAVENDPRVQSFTLPMRHGLTLILKLGEG